MISRSLSSPLARYSWGCWNTDRPKSQLSRQEGFVLMHEDRQHFTGKMPSWSKMSCSGTVSWTRECVEILSSEVAFDLCHGPGSHCGALAVAFLKSKR